MNELENSFLYRDILPYTTYERLKKAGLVKLNPADSKGLK